MFYQKTYDDIWSLVISDEFKAVITNDDLVTDTVQLESEDEAKKLIAEFEDEDGELMYAEDAIMGKYEAFHKMRP